MAARRQSAIWPPLRRRRYFFSLPFFPRRPQSKVNSRTSVDMKRAGATRCISTVNHPTWASTSCQRNASWHGGIPLCPRKIQTVQLAVGLMFKQNVVSFWLAHYPEIIWYEVYRKSWSAWLNIPARHLKCVIPVIPVNTHFLMNILKYV